MKFKDFDGTLKRFVPVQPHNLFYEAVPLVAACPNMGWYSAPTNTRKYIGAMQSGTCELHQMLLDRSKPNYSRNVDESIHSDSRHMNDP